MTLPAGFTLVSSTYIKEIASHADLFTHDGTGARILSMRNTDENKVFGITFRTPPKDSTGVAHILEHSVLCGSRKYPVKEPFVELLKGSLQTFLNAMTFPDKTAYPVATQNLKDFYNLIDVYLDAVFFPRMTQEIFEQEGWHLDLDAPEAAPTIKGVVYNEMKGVYSSPDSMLFERSQQSLFPDTTYGLDSGGNPEKIPDLTYEQFMDFHRTYYHPSNAWIFFYGDDDPEARLELLREYLDQFSCKNIPSHLTLQKPFSAPREFRYAFEASETGNGRGMLTLNWLCADQRDATTMLACKMLDHLLTGMNASPLRKALIESGLGEDITGCGMEQDMVQMYYSVGLKGVQPADFPAVRTLITDTLRSIATHGFEPDLLDAAINSAEFDLRENNTGSYPRGLLVMLRALGSWLYDADPFDFVAFEAPLAQLKTRLAHGEPVFEQLIQKNLLDNPHQTTVFLEPQAGYAEELEQAEQERITQVRHALAHVSDPDLARRTALLRQMQETPDRPEDLATIPGLSREDIDPAVRTVPTEIKNTESATVLQHDLPTNGICYCDLALDLTAVPDRLIPLLPLFCRALTEMGTTEEDYVSFSKRINSKTGGIHARCLLASHEIETRPVTRLILRAKAVSERVSDMLDIMRDALLLARFDDAERFRQMALEEKAGLEHALVPAGHQFVGLRLRSKFTLVDSLQERLSGLESLFFLRDLLTRIEQDWPSVLADLETLRTACVSRHNAVLNLTMDESGLHTHHEAFGQFLSLLPGHAPQPALWTTQFPREAEAVCIPAQVNYVGKICDLHALGYTFHGASLVASRYVRTSWLWEQVRVLGGAYGAFCSYGRLSGLMSFGSYRDPNITSTLAAFDQCGAFLESAPLDAREITKAIIGTSGDLDPYQLPDAKGFSSLAHYLGGIDITTRQRIRDEVLSTEEQHLRTFGTVLREAAHNGLVCVLGSEDALAKAQNIPFARTIRPL